MIDHNDLISVHSNITFDCEDCSMEIIVTNNYVTLNATKISKRGFIVREGVSIDRGKVYHQLMNFINSYRDTISELMEKARERAAERDVMNYNNED